MGHSKISVEHAALALGLIALGGACSDRGAPAMDLDGFFSLEAVHSLEIDVDDAGVTSLLAEPKTYVEGAVTVDGERFEGVGVRLKGSAGSFVPLDGDYPEVSMDGNGNPGKSAFIVDFNRYAPGQDFRGLKKLTVNNLVQDPSGLHEYLGYSLFRAGDVPASRAGFATVWLNGETKGLYALVESQDNDTLLDTWFGSDDGNLYEGQYGADLIPDRVEQFDQDHGDDVSLQDLRDLSLALAAISDQSDIVPTLEAQLDLDAYLRFAATEIYLGHWDGYVQSANNYAIFHDLDDEGWWFMPWGIDQLFEDDMGPHAGVMSGPGPSWWEQGGVVHRLCIQSMDCRERLHQAFLDLFGRVEDSGFVEIPARGRALIEDLLYQESVAHGDPDRTASALATIDAHMYTRRSALERWMPCLVGEVVDQDGDGSDDCSADCDAENPDRHPGAAETCDFIDQDCNGVVDDPAMCPRCRPFAGPDGASYLLCFQPRPWTEARADCVAQGGDLASIHDPETAEVLGFVVPELIGHERAYIGLNDQSREGDFQWSDGSPMDFERWGEGAPAPPPESEGMDCVQSEPWGWHDIACEEPLAYVCKI